MERVIPPVAAFASMTWVCVSLTVFRVNTTSSPVPQLAET
jgi:hypothetical protein